MNNNENYDDQSQGAEMELELVKSTLLLNPENQKLSEEELNKLALEEIKDAHSS